jgi:hypothetical protein
VKELNLLIGSKMKAHFPQGKLNAITESEEHEEINKEEKENSLETRPRSQIVRQNQLPQAQTTSTREPKHELDALEDQLRDIESQLKNIQ